jgi:hypothetical protein
MDDDAKIAAAGAMTEALETLERARGHLYSFHQLIGKTDFKLDEVLEHLGELGETELAETLKSALVGRNVIEGRWTFQIMEEFDDGYYAVFREQERAIRDALVDGRRHLHEARLKAKRQPSS